LKVAASGQTPTTVQRRRRITMAEGDIDKGKGRLKEAAGDLTGDKGLKNEGKTDRAGGSVKNAVDSVTDKIKGKD
jgi:uncharacterized protein YjbJ (UPF0337 family)